ncbi:MAG: c-type cytochrome biogenesis protein CcsB [Anaerolinea sp.]|nr:c-type cytochrome biogenesis protein CcsB [Anaerolinea sp.]
MGGFNSSVGALGGTAVLETWYVAFWAGLVSLAASTVVLARSIRWYSGRASGLTATADSMSLQPRAVPRYSPRPFSLGMGLLWVASGALLVSLIARTVAAQAPPMSNMWGYFLAMGFAMAAFAAWFGQRYREPALPLVVALVVLLGLLASERSFDSAIRPLIPALQANRLLTIHVTIMTLSYAMITTASAASVLYLVKSYFPGFPGLPPTEKASRIAHTAATMALPLLTVGIAFGAYWANSAWGRYWAWDPKETASLLTLLVLVEYVHMQGLRKWRGRRASWVLVIAFGSIVFNMVAVNFWVTGLHSYAK